MKLAGSSWQMTGQPDIALIVGALTRRGYTVITATDGKEAIRAHAWHPGKIDLLVTDVDMAPMNGCELATLLITAQSDLRVVFVSSHVGGDVLRRKQDIPGELVLPKPFTSDELLSKVGCPASAGNGESVLPLR